MSADAERQMTPLEAAMSSSFVYDPEAVENKVDVAPAASTACASTDAPPADTTPVTSEEEPGEDQNDWRDEYDLRLTEWRAAASVSREKAERERAKWEAIREDEAKNGISRPPFPETPASAASGPDVSMQSTLSMSGWQSVGGESTLASSMVSVAGPGDSPSPADARDFVTGEHRGGHGAEVLQVLGPRPTAPERVSTAEAIGSGAVTTDEDSGKSASHWENLPSLASSFPSLPSHPHSSPPTKSKDTETKAPPPSQARSITLLLFDSATSTRTRLLALTAALGINFLLPFINGVMIGFGEIAAKGIVNWWRTGRALSATAAGMRTAHPIV